MKTRTARPDRAMPGANSLLAAGLCIVVGFFFSATLPFTASAQNSGLELATLRPTDDIPTQLGALPRPLSSADVARYRMIFELQDKGRWREADHLIRQLGNKLLLGHVQAQRYLHPTAYRSSYKELRDWLRDYADLPQSKQIHALAMKRKPAGSEAPKSPVAGFLGGSGQELLEERETDYAGPQGRSKAATREVTRWLAEISRLVSKDRPTQATRLLDRKAAKLADDVERDIARWIIARGYFANRKDELALRYAGEAAERSGSIEPRMHWTAGLAAWRHGQIETARRHFVAMAATDAPGEEIAAAGFWAARAYLALRKPDMHRRYLETAARSSDGFYGLLARGLLGLPVVFDWHEAGLGPSLLDLLVRFPGSRRAIALGQVDRRGLAGQEIRKLAARARPQLTEALAALAESLKLPATQMRVAQRLRLQDGRRHDGAMYPLPDWRPETGYDVDRAILFSLMRAESGFDPQARSHAGALGVMQVLPSTAKTVARRAKLDYAGKNSLKNPETNMTIGQAYVSQLLDNGIINGSLIHTAVAYNAGLKRLENWVGRYRDLDFDPLLFLESIPIPETRLYTKKVLANIWAYRVRLDQPLTSMRQLAANDWPIYSAHDNGLRYARKN